MVLKLVIFYSSLSSDNYFLSLLRISLTQRELKNFFNSEGNEGTVGFSG